MHTFRQWLYACLQRLLQPKKSWSFSAGVLFDDVMEQQIINDLKTHALNAKV